MTHTEVAVSLTSDYLLFTFLIMFTTLMLSSQHRFPLKVTQDVHRICAGIDIQGCLPDMSSQFD